MEGTPHPESLVSRYTKYQHLYNRGYSYAVRAHQQAHNLKHTLIEGEGQKLWGFHLVNYSWHLVPISGPLLDLFPHSFLDACISCWWSPYYPLSHMPSVHSTGVRLFFSISFHLTFQSEHRQ